MTEQHATDPHPGAPGGELHPARVAPLGRPSPYGEPAAVESMGGIASPLLAGFSLTLIGFVAQAPDRLRWPDLALLLLATTTVAMLGAVQFAFRARRFAATPAEAADWHPDFSTDPQRRARVYDEIRAHRRAHMFWTSRARRFYNTGVCLLLAGLAVTLWPADRPHTLRILAVAVVVAALTAELILIGGGWLLAGRLGHRLPSRVATTVWWMTSGNPLTRPHRLLSSGKEKSHDE